MAEPRNCGSCGYLCRTSPEQVFLLCRFWSADVPPVRGAFRAYGYDFVVAHCHMQPEAPACEYYRPREERSTA